MNSYKSELEKELLSISNTLKEKISNTTNFFDNKICILNRAYEVLETINKFDIFEKVQTEFDKFWFNFNKNSSRTTITRSEIVNKLNKISKSNRVNLLIDSIKDNHEFLEEIQIINEMSNGLNDFSWEDIWNYTVNEANGSKIELLKAVKMINSNDSVQPLLFGSNIEKLLVELKLNTDNISIETTQFVEKVKKSINLLLKLNNQCLTDLEKMFLKLNKKVVYDNDMYYNINIKNIDLALDSVIRNHHGNALHLTDLIWCDLIFNNINDMDKIIKELLNFNNEYPFYVQEIIDNFDFTKSAISQNGYRDIKLQLINKNSGIICELRLHLKEMYELKENLNIKYGCDISLLSQSFINDGIFVFNRILERVDVPVRYQLCEIYIEKILESFYSQNDFLDEINIIHMLRRLGLILCDLKLFDEVKNIINFKTCDIIKRNYESDIIFARTLHVLASTYIQNELFIETIELFNQVKDLIEKNFGPNHIEVINAIRNKAIILFKKNKLDEAIKEFLIILRISEKLFGSDHVHIGFILNELSLIYCEKKKYKEALEIAHNALNIFKENFGTTHIYYLKVEYTMINILERQDNRINALSLCNNCINNFITLVGTEHEHSSLLLSKKGKIQINLGLYNDGLQSLEIALKINQRIYGLNDSKTIATLLDLANGLYLASKIKESLDLYYNILTIQEKKIGLNNINIINNLISIALILMKDKNYLESITILEKILDIYEANNKYDINYFNTILNLIRSYLYLDKNELAEIFIKKSFDINQKILNSIIDFEEYKNTLNVISKGLMRIAYIYKNKNNFDYALNILEYTLTLNLCEDKIKIQEENEDLNFYSKYLPIIHVCIGSIHNEINNIDYAIYNYQKAVYIWLPLKKNNLDILRTLNGLTKLYEKKNNWKKAEETYNTILIFQNEMFGKESKEVAQTFEKIGICNVNLKNFNHALDYFKMSQEILNELYINSDKIYNEVTIESKSLLLENIAKIYFLIGKVYTQLSKNNEAIESYKLSITSYETLGAVLVCLERYKEAIKLFQHELKLKNNLHNLDYNKSNLENINPNKKRRHISKI